MSSCQEAKEAFAEWIDRMSIKWHEMISVNGCSALLDCGHTVNCHHGCSPVPGFMHEKCWRHGKKSVLCPECDRLDVIALGHDPDVKDFPELNERLNTPLVQPLSERHP
jgi:hypothetical protein